MPEGASVRPKKWKSVRTLFDDGDTSVISGLYDGGSQRLLGIRWNGGEGELGFPNVAGMPIWHVLPDFLAIPILLGLSAELAGRRGAREGRFARSIRRELVSQYGAHAQIKP